MAVNKGKGPTRRRLSSRQSFDPIPLPVSKEATALQERRLMSGKPKRPTRWRGPKTTDSSSKTRPKHIAPAVQSQAVMQSVQKQNEAPENHQPKSQPVELRFSFSATPVELRFSFSTASDENSSRRGREETFTQSFSGLSMTGSANRSISADPSHAKAVPAQEPRRHSESTSQAPQLTKPKKKREGYGFSYSETFMCDSDEYPDTECEWEPDDLDASRPVTGHSTPCNPYLNWEKPEPISRPASRNSACTIEDDSFNDLVVLRDVGSFHLARPQRPLPCTSATREDTLRLKLRAKALFSRFEESADIQAQLLTRMERMMYAEQQRGSRQGEANALPMCALKLRDFLIRVKDERVETGEHRTIVEHEIEWVEWFVDASKTGVMHVRNEGCTCRPDWDPE